MLVVRMYLCIWLLSHVPLYVLLYILFVRIYCNRICVICLAYHQKCHVPTIPDEVLDPNEEWICTYCEQGIACPYVVNQEEVVSVLYTSPQRKRTKFFKSEEVHIRIRMYVRIYVFMYLLYVHLMYVCMYHDARVLSLQKHQLQYIPHILGYISDLITDIQYPLF